MSENDELYRQVIKILKNSHTLDVIFNVLQNDVMIVAQEKAASQCWKQYVNVKRKIFTTKYKQIVDDFYDNYYPTRYDDRRGSLYNVFSFQVKSINGSKVIVMEFLPSKLPYRDGTYPQDNEAALKGSIYETVMVRGYHGGSTHISSNKKFKWGIHPEPGIPYWRRPHLYSEKWGVWFYPYWYRRAVKEKESIIEQMTKFNDEWNDPINPNGGKQIYTKIRHKYEQRFYDQEMRKINKLYKMLTN